MALGKILKADSAGPAAYKLYEKSHAGLAGLLPAALLTSEGSSARQAVDIGLGILIPVHSHIGLNAVVSDYVPKSLRCPTRWATLGLSCVAFAGLLKHNLQGAGLTSSVLQLWKKPEK